jgi:hypothetical protein
VIVERGRGFGALVSVGVSGKSRGRGSEKSRDHVRQTDVIVIRERDDWPFGLFKTFVGQGPTRELPRFGNSRNVEMLCLHCRLLADFYLNPGAGLLRLRSLQKWAFAVRGLFVSG